MLPRGRSGSSSRGGGGGAGGESEEGEGPGYPEALPIRTVQFDHDPPSPIASTQEEEEEEAQGTTAAATAAAGPAVPANARAGGASKLPPARREAGPNPFLEDSLRAGGRGGGGGVAMRHRGRRGGSNNPFDDDMMTGELPGGIEISPSLLQKQRSVMPVEIYEVMAPPAPAPPPPRATVAARAPAASVTATVASPSPRMDESARPYVDHEEEDVERGEGGGATTRYPPKRMSFRRRGAGGGGEEEEEAGAPQQEEEEQDGADRESVDPALAKSYDARQIGFHIARTYKRLYDEHQRGLLAEQYKDILGRHGQNTTVRRMHRQIVLDVLESSDTSPLTILANGMCPLALRPVLRALCCWRLEPNYWQKNLDDEITFYAIQFLAFSILPIFPTLWDTCVSILSSLQWEIKHQSCREVHPFTATATGSWGEYSAASSQGGAAAGEGPSYNSTTCGSLDFRDAVAVGATVDMGNAQLGSNRHYFTDPVVWNTASGTCRLSETISGLVTAPQVGVLLIYVAFILWALYELYGKLRELRYMKIANHLRAVYVPNMVIQHARTAKRHRRKQPDEKQQSSSSSGWRLPWWWGGGKSDTTAATTEEGDKGDSSSGSQAESHPRPRPRRPSIDDLPSSTAGASYPTRQFPTIFLLLLTALLCLCLVALYRASNHDMECLIVPQSPAGEGMRKWVDSAYAAWLARSGRRRSTTEMCYAVWRCVSPPGAAGVSFPFLISYRQTTVSTLLDVIMRTGIFAATAYKLTSLLRKSYFFIDIERYMDPAFEPPYKGIHEHRSRIMTREMVEDYICLRREMFIDAVRKNLPYLFDPGQLELAFTPKYQNGLTPDIS